MELFNLITPKAKTEQITVEELDNEVVVYDHKRHKVHCLNRPAALTWKYCDGRRTISELCAAVEQELQAEFTPEVALHGLRELKRCGLVEGNLEQPAAVAGMSRREFLKQAAIVAAVALPVILSITSPTPAAAAPTCKGFGQPCLSHAECCSGRCSLAGRCR